MSWLKALERVRQEAVIRAPRTFSQSSMGVLSRLTPGVTVEVSQQKPLEMPEVGPSTAALHCVSNSWVSGLQVIRFSQTGSQGALEWPMHRLSLPLAARCVALLLEAGQTIAALQLLHSWKSSPAKVRLHTRIRASVQLKRAIKTLGVIGDVETLRFVVSVLHQALTEQRQHRRTFLILPRSRATAAFDDGDVAAQAGTGESHPLLSALGMQRTRVLLVKAVHELLMQDERAVSLLEKLTWINATAIATSSMPSQGAHVHCIIPHELQEDFSVVERSATYNEHLLQQVGPAFACGFLHPTQCELVEILSTPLSEVRRMYKNGFLRLPSEAWAEAGHLVLCQSPLIQKAFQLEALLGLLFSPDAARAAVLPWRPLHPRYVTKATKEQRLLRQHIVAHLQSSRSLTRRLWSRALLRHPRLLCQLGISPLMVFRVCALTFRSFRVHKRFSRCCMALLRRMQRVGRIEDAARLVWNHLSVDDSTLATLFSRHPMLLDDAVTVVCCAMRRALSANRREAWMGHRSLAVLRVAAAAGLLTPAHCFSTCSAALDCGIHFATVQELVSEAFGDGSDTARWVLNMVRLMAEIHSVSLHVPLECPAHSAYMRNLLRQHVHQLTIVRPPSSVEVRLPSRSKLLALWAIVNDDSISASLRLLVCQLFLDEEAQNTLKGMGEQKPLSVHQMVGAFFREEVLASVAANCTKEGSYLLSMKALLSRRRNRDGQRCMQLMLSEMSDEYAHVASSCISSDV